LAFDDGGPRQCRNPAAKFANRRRGDGEPGNYTQVSK
jgi:hypothetical protein